MTPRSLFWLAVLLSLPSGIPFAQATLFKGTPGGKGDVVVYPAPGSTFTSPQELRGIQLLPVDAAGRSAFTQFQPDQPRLKSDLPLASRVILPQDRGALYRYRRDGADGADFGYFVVHSDGQAHFLASFRGTGPDGTDDPVPFPVAVSGQGDTLLVATTLLAGGDLFEIGTVSGAVLSVTGALPPQDFLAQGLILLPTWGAALTSRGPIRFARGGGAASRVELLSRSGTTSTTRFVQPPPPAYFAPGIVMSADGSTVALVAGANAANAHVFAFGATGPSVCVNDLPAPIAGPGFGTQAGPKLALSPNGKRVAWKTEDALGGECFSRRVPGGIPSAEAHVTGDLHFTDTLNETGVIAFLNPDTAVLLVGEPNGAGGVEKADIYQAKFPLTGGMVLTNLTNTSGDTQAPFLTKGALETQDGIFQIPGELGTVYFVDGRSGQGQVMRMDPTSGTVDLIRDGVAQLDFIERTGPGFTLGILHDQPVQRELLFVPFDHSLPGKSLGIFSSTNLFASHAGNAAGTFAGVMSVTGGQWLGQLFLPTDSSALLTSVPRTYGPVLGFDGNGSVLASIRLGLRSFFLSWPSGGGVGFYDTGGADGLVLPGN